MDETETRYFAEYQEMGSQDWYVAGDMGGYTTRRDAEKAIEAERTKAQRRRGRFTPLTAGRIRTQVTTSTIRPYLFV